MSQLGLAWVGEDDVKLSGLQMFLKKRLERSTRLTRRDEMPASSKVVRYEVDEE